MSMRTFLLGLCLTGLISSCASTQVHLFTEGLSQIETTTLTESLEDQGFEVIHNSLPIPEGIVTPTILYSPLHGNLGDVERLRELLGDTGNWMELEPVSRGNHHYTGINVGVYPRAFTGGHRQITVLGKELFGECPEDDVTLSLHRDLTFELTIYSWNETKNVEETTASTGTWWQHNDTVTLQLARTEIPLSILYLSGSTEYARVDGIKLQNLNTSKQIAGCDFVYKELDPW